MPSFFPIGFSLLEWADCNVTIAANKWIVRCSKGIILIYTSPYLVLIALTTCVIANNHSYITCKSITT